MDIELTPDKELPPNVGKLINQLELADLSKEERDRVESEILYGFLLKESTGEVPPSLRITGAFSYFNETKDRWTSVNLGSKGIRIERPPGVVTLGDLVRQITTPVEREKEQRADKLPKLRMHKEITPFDSVGNLQLGGGRRRTRHGNHDHISQELERLMAHGRHHGVIPPPPMPDGAGDLIGIWNKFGKALHLGAKSIRKALTRKQDMMSSTLGKTAGRGGRRKRTRRR